MAVYYEKTTGNYVARYELRIGSFPNKTDARIALNVVKGLAKSFEKAVRSIFPRYRRRLDPDVETAVENAASSIPTV